MSLLFKTEKAAPKAPKSKVVFDEAMLARIDELYRAGMKRLPDAGDWYQDTLINIQNIMTIYDDRGGVREDSDERALLFVDLLAATSPRTSIVRNTFLTTQIFSFINDGILCKIKMEFEAHLTNVCRALLNLPLSGQKVLSFQANLLGDKNAVTIDTWMMRVFQRNGDAPTTAEYEELSDATRKLARKYSISPSQMQAALWVGIKALEGDPADTPEPFEKTLRRFKERQDAQGEIDFGSAEGKFKAAEQSLAKHRDEAANPNYSSQRTIGARLVEVCEKDAGISDELAHLICDQPPGLLMGSILFCRHHMPAWMRRSGAKRTQAPVAELRAFIGE